jgi:hypothetical protein
MIADQVATPPPEAGGDLSSTVMFEGIALVGGLAGVSNGALVVGAIDDRDREFTVGSTLGCPATTALRSNEAVAAAKDLSVEPGIELQLIASSR